jgi:GNAT superfamily N-acetyltransferase
MNPAKADREPLSIELMTKTEVQTAVDWAQQEGWNPGFHDAECFYNADPAGFYAAKVSGEVVGTVSVVKYSENFAFEGLMIVKPEFRGQGVGSKIQVFVNNLCRNLNLGLDGVLSMQQKYEHVGFKFAYKNTRYRGVINAEVPKPVFPSKRKTSTELSLLTQSSSLLQEQDFLNIGSSKKMPKP